MSDQFPPDTVGDAARQEELDGSRTTAMLKASAKAEKLRRAISLAEEGLSPTDIGARLGLHGTTVAKWLRDAGYSRKR